MLPQRVALEQAITEYYGSLSGEEREELAAWGELAMREFPDGAA